MKYILFDGILNLRKPSRYYSDNLDLLSKTGSIYYVLLKKIYNSSTVGGWVDG